ncbi:MAG: hypothetical protein HN353_09210 [Bdellovibrionales bacterium]|jgi:hypothetical protein|nr:hypothetical protein [Bdellovibrionales bacterium]MBT3527310.1 hypothetical protein [Bdellovibrionales bacterium]MBT7669325.1 hypothetical protein [Bdellovibrionales bacterium]MBT7767033.1 hypothetical protein [Bdellovibrionales bacterium]
MVKLVVLFIIFLPLLLSQVSALDIKVDSNIKGAYVYLSAKGEPSKRVGVTPASLPNVEMKNGLMLHVEYRNHAPVSIPISSEHKQNLELDIELKPLFSLGGENRNNFFVREVQLKTEQALDDIMEVQFLIEDNQLNLALTNLRKLRDTFPQSIFIEVLFANALVRSGKKTEARQVLDNILKRVPADQANTKKMIELFQKRL